ncbi:MAG: glutathione synthase [Alphaproteobacteria bacterium]|nr:glutathione synthase [Alphaproteobacteria bacterium]
MSLAVAIQMDAIEPIDINADSTFALAEEAQRRGHRLYHYLVTDLSLKTGRVVAWGRTLEVRREVGNHASLGPLEELELADMDVILMRQDPPFDMAYITATHVLEHIHPKTLVVNDPASVRNAPEKLFVTHFPELMPPTLITANGDEIKAFREEHRDIIIKPLFGNGGSGVFHIQPGDENLTALIEMFTERSREPIIAQGYLPAVRLGDKRIILVDGEAVGAINRVPAEGEARSNMHVGGTPLKSELTARDIEICRTIGPVLKEQGMIFVGIDVIGDYLTEINVTSPTGIQECSRFDGSDLSGLIWDAIERRR